ncbi:uncharacterized protein BCR38DRAFT_431594 [Pseudomassariella vexata]|uniref:NACHT-NTPase and P-loop NTPases N-terminal domain-containing protein n=1 Tax=Pseudomassariella vexata TaxID=1141098 RepID=A0A1Y2E0J0_9PEZI|nr:uncharacterized protein BCR38DRAFT_431594 [Pseudomassariella vexata]ORY64997.1 hypothetical protein BCR38DRAFT_431594 [Pseudomassariella vexata]
MSGAEATAVLGVISSVIAIVEGIKKVYDAASSANGLPEAFREVAGRLPIITGILESAEQHIRDGQLDTALYEKTKLLIEKCKERAMILDGIFQKVLPAGDASRWARYIGAVKALGKEGKVETLMKGLLDDLLLLASRNGLETATADQVDQLGKAIEDLSGIEPSIPDSEFRETAFANNNFGTGPMTANNVVGNQKFQANYGTGKQFQAETQTFHMGKDD